MTLRAGSEAEAVAAERLEEHFEGWFARAEADFRSASLNELIATHVPPGARVLDVGCGSGALAAVLARRGHTVSARDPSAAMVDMARRYLAAVGVQGVDLGQADSAGLPKDHAYDVVTALDVIEHIEDDLGALRDMHGALAPSGRLLVTVPAMSRLYGPKDQEIGHYRRYDRATLASVVERAGFEVERMRWWNAVGVAPVWISLKRNRRVSEGFRYAEAGGSPSRLNAALRLWFRTVENRVRPPRGLTLLVQARPRA